MNRPWDQLSREELLEQHLLLQERFTAVEFQLEQLKRLVFGARRERFIAEATPAGQLPLFTQQEAAAAAQIIAAKQQIAAHERTSVKQQPKRRGEFPPNLPRRLIVLQPDQPIEGLRKIGEDVSETLDYRAAEVVVVRRVRPRYVDPQDEDRGVIIAPAADRPFAKSIAEVGLVVQLIIDKFCDHLPLHRQAKRFRRMGIELSDSVLGDLVEQAFVLLFPLWECLRRRVLAGEYLQTDETRIQVQKVKKGKTHRGYLWGYHAVCARLAFFEYQHTRERAGPAHTLQDFAGHLQSDAYSVYDAFDKREGINLFNCWAHARRKFDEARTNDPDTAAEALTLIQKLYLLERQIEEPSGTEPFYRLRYEQRQELAVPILDQLKTWLDAKQRQALPQSPIGKAIHYSLVRWPRLMHYTSDGRLEIDNNLLENLFRPVALGRKNYLFAGSPEGAKRAALFYSLLACCQLHGLNPFHYLYDVLWRINDHPLNQLDQLLPDRWQPIRKPDDDHNDHKIPAEVSG